MATGYVKAHILYILFQSISHAVEMVRVFEIVMMAKEETLNANGKKHTTNDEETPRR